MAHYLYLQLLVDHGASTQLLLLLLVSSLLLVLAAATSSGRRRCINKKLQLPPSPPGKLPVIGHLHLVAGSLPHASLRDLAAAHGRGDGLLLLRLGAVPTLVVSSPRAAEAVLRTHDHALSSRPWSPVADILFYGASSVGFAPYGDGWRRSRKVVAARMLSARKVESFRRGRLDEVRLVLSRLREQAAAGAAVDVSEAVSAYANDVVCRAVLGDSHRARGRNRLLMELVGENVALLGGFNLEDYFPRLTKVELLRRLICARAHRVHRRWDRLFDELIEEHQQQDETQDLIHVLLAAEEEYGLNRDNIKALLMETFQAGIESSYVVLDYAMAELMLNRHVMAGLQTEVRTTTLLASSASGNKKQAGNKDMDMAVVTEEDLSKMPYLKAVVKETLRLHPPAPLLIPRLSTADCDVVDGGCWIPAGTRIFVNAWAIGRDPAAWDRAEEFMPERFLEHQQEEGPGNNDNSEAAAAAALDMMKKSTYDFAFLPFGAGRRICPGINFGIATVEIMLANLMYHFDWKLPNEGTSGSDGGGVDMSEVFGMALRRKEKLFLVPTIPASSSSSWNQQDYKTDLVHTNLKIGWVVRLV